MNHETDEDLIREDRIAAEFARYRSCSQCKIAAEHCLLDRVLIAPSGSVIGFAEIKSCNYPFGKFPHGYLDRVDKHRAAFDAWRVFKIPVYLVVEFTDALAWLDMLTTPVRRGLYLDVPERNARYPAVCYEWKYFNIDRGEASVGAAQAQRKA